MSDTTPPPAAERFMIGADYSVQFEPCDDTVMAWLIDPKDEVVASISNADAARAFAAAMTTPPQGRPSREAVARTLYAKECEIARRAPIFAMGASPSFEGLIQEDRNSFLEQADAVLALWPSSPQPATAAPLWCVHVRGPDDLVPVASYDDAVRLSDGLNWWWWSLPRFTENDPLISAIPALWDGTAEEHARGVAKLGTRGADYAVPTEDQVEAKRVAAFKLRVERSRPQSAMADAEVQQ